MFKAPNHQVAGHRAHEGLLGPLIDDLGNFYKPLQNDERGTKEEAFYTSFTSDDRIPTKIRRFFPAFHGTKLLEASDGSGLHPHLILEDLVSKRLNPSVMDIKMGSRTWYPEASDEYIKKCLEKDKDSTSVLLGFRISGLQAYEDDKSSYWKPDKKTVQNYTPEDVKLVLKKFVSSNPSVDAEPDCSFAKTVYGGPNGIRAQLLELKLWFEDQTMYHFNSCSILMVHEKSSGGEIKLVDFAHVVDGQGVIDHNFLGGLCSLIKFVADVLASPDNVTS